MVSQRNEQTKTGLINCIRRAKEMIFVYGNKTDQSSMYIVKMAMKNLADAERLLGIIESKNLDSKLKAADTFYPRRA